MRIGVDASRANHVERTGVEWYAYHVLCELAALPESKHHQWVTYAPTELVTDVKSKLSDWEERCLSWPPKYLWTQARLSFELAQVPPDLLFVPAHALPRILPKKTVVTIHDVGFRRFPELYPSFQVALHDIYTRDIVRSNACILTVSEFSKRELQEMYHVAEERIEVTPLGIDSHYRPHSREDQTAVRELFQLGEHPFALYIGRLEEKKNTERFVEAFFAFAERDADAHCVLAGIKGNGWSRVESLIRRHPQGHRVHILGYVDERDKPALLSAATCYIQPSLYEGFGLPILEAMACGTMVISSTAGSLPEVGGDAVACYVDPYSVTSIAEGLESVFRLPVADQQAYIERGCMHATRYTWKQTAQATLTAIERYG